MLLQPMGILNLVVIFLPSYFIRGIHDSQHGAELLGDKLTLEGGLHVFLDKEYLMDISVCVCGGGGCNMCVCGGGGLQCVCVHAYIVLYRQ